MRASDFFKTRKEYVLLLLILALAWYLRTNHQWLLPFFYNADEYFVVMPSLHILQTGNLNPQVFKYGSFVYYLTALLYWMYFHTVSALSGTSYPDLLRQLTSTSPVLYTIARYESSFFDLLNIVMTYRISRNLFHREPAALAAALIVALNPLHLYMSHMAKVDTALTFFVLLTFFFALRIADQGRRRDMVLAGICAGLAMATKYDVLALLPPLAAVFVYRSKHPGTHRPGVAVLIVAIAAVVFFLASPYTVLDLRGFLADFSAESAQQGLSLSTLGWLHTRFVYQFLIQLPFCLSISVFLFFIAGIAGYHRLMDNNTFVLFLSYPLVFFIAATASSASISQVIFSHLYLTILPFMIMLAAAAALSVLSGIPTRFLKYSAAALLLFDIVIASANFQSMLSTYREAGAWLASIRPSGVVRLSSVTPFTLYLGGNYETQMIEPSPLLLEQVRTFNPRLILVSEGWYTTYFYRRERYYNRHIDRLLSDRGYRTIKTFSPSSFYIDLFGTIDNALDIGTIRIFERDR